MKWRILLTVGGILAVALSASAQVLPANASGITASHEHLLVTDPVASASFWTALGAAPTQIGSMSGVKTSGVYILFQASRGRGGPRGRGGQTAAAQGPSAPPARAASGPVTSQDGAQPAAVSPPPAPESSVGSVAEAIGFKVKSLRDTLAKLDAIGVKPEAGATAKVATVMSPEKVKVVLTQDASIPTQIASNELLMRVPNPAEAAAWYGQWFGATVVKDGNDSVAQIPGMNMRFVETKEAMAGTHGRALDHIGFNVQNLQAFATKLQEGGVTINTPFRTMSLGFITAITFITDPWGTYIELNEGYTGN